MKNYDRFCPHCKNAVFGRANKLFCDIDCKNQYHSALRRKVAEIVRETDKMLHRNYAILLEILGDNSSRKTISRLTLEKKNFHFSCFTGYTSTTRGKICRYLYDFAWIEFNSQKILVLRI
ncbi:MAG: hypothetical protein R3D00_18795 [Bacteroidia bacterium]